MRRAAAGLFDEPPLPGLGFEAAFLDAAEQQALLAPIAALPFAPFEFQQWQGKRRVVSFGWRYDFGDAQLRPAEPLPPFLEPLRARAAALAGVEAAALEQLLVTEYAAGAGIGWHRDRPVFERVVGISLAAPCVLRFRRRRANGFERHALPLPAGSAYVLGGAAREQWEHSIAPLPQLRYSLTFRSLRQRLSASRARSRAADEGS